VLLGKVKKGEGEKLRCNAHPKKGSWKRRKRKGVIALLIRFRGLKKGEGGGRFQEGKKGKGDFAKYQFPFCVGLLRRSEAGGKEKKRRKKKRGESTRCSAR